MRSRKDIYNDADVASLPQWAQSGIRTLKRNLADAQKRLNAGPEDSDTFADPYMSEAARPLGRGTIVRFGGQDYNNTFDVKIKDGELHVSGASHFAGEVVIRPRASNSFTVGFAERR